MEQMRENRAEFERIMTILNALTPEGREAWLRKGADMASTIQILEAGGYRVVPEGK